MCELPFILFSQLVEEIIVNEELFHSEERKKSTVHYSEPNMYFYSNSNIFLPFQNITHCNQCGLILEILPEQGTEV